MSKRPTRARRTLGFEFLKPPRSGRVVVEAEEPRRCGAGDKELLDDASFALERGEHVALVGPNGSGKTTLLETILGRREPAAGRVRLGHGVEPAYFSQHEAELDERGSVLDAAVAGTGLRRPEAQKLLGRFLFSGWEEHEKPVAALSGGERRRLALALVVATRRELPRPRRADEPPRPRDRARRSKPRSRRSRGRCCSSRTTGRCSTPSPERLLAVEERRIVSYPGGWADYARAQAGEPPPAPEPTPKPRRERPARPPKPQPDPARARRARDRARRGADRASSSGSSPTTGRTSTSLAAHRAAREPTSRRCSGAGKRCSKRADRVLADRIEHENRLVDARFGELAEQRRQLIVGYRR